MMVASKEEVADLAVTVEDLVHISHGLSVELEALRARNEALVQQVKRLEDDMARHEEYVVSRFQGFVNHRNP